MLPELDGVIHQPVRLRIMTLLYRNRHLPYVTVRDQLGLTDGNLASHAKRLEDARYLEARRTLTPSGFELRYVITPEGTAAFRAYLARLRELLDAAEAEPPARALPPEARGSPAGI